MWIGQREQKISTNKFWVENRVKDQVEDRVENRVENRVEDRVEDQVEDQVEDPVENRVENRWENRGENRVENQVDRVDWVDHIDHLDRVDRVDQANWILNSKVLCCILGMCMFLFYHFPFRLCAVKILDMGPIMLKCMYEAGLWLAYLWDNLYITCNLCF